MTEPEFLTSSYSDNGGACVEVAANLAQAYGIVPVRDSKRPDGPVLTLPATAFTAFLTEVKAPSWAKSSYSNNGGDCVEIAANLVAPGGAVSVRDSKIPDGPVLAVPAEAFSAFVGGVKSGGLDAV